MSYKYPCKSVLIEFAPFKYQKVNKHPKFYNNFNILRQLEQFKYDMNRTQVVGKNLCKLSAFILENNVFLH